MGGQSSRCSSCPGSPGVGFAESRHALQPEAIAQNLQQSDLGTKNLTQDGLTMTHRPAAYHPFQQSFIASRVQWLQQKPHGLQSPKYLLSDPLKKKFTDSWY